MFISIDLLNKLQINFDIHHLVILIILQLMYIYMYYYAYIYVHISCICNFIYIIAKFMRMNLIKSIHMWICVFRYIFSANDFLVHANHIVFHFLQLMHIYMYICVCIYIHIHTSVHICTCMYICVYTYMCIYMYIDVHICIYGTHVHI